LGEYLHFKHVPLKAEIHPRLYHYYKFSQYYLEKKNNPYCHYGYQELFIDFIF
jgi:hypothetical protein